MKRNWRAAAFAAALCMALTATTGCAEKIDQTAGGNLITTTPVTEEATEAPTAAPELTERAKKLLAQNPDTVGYITIADTQVDNPVVQTIDNEYYLNHTVSGEYNNRGSIFLDANANAQLQDDNSIIYGHSVEGGGMFTLLKKYCDEDFFKSHPVFYVLTPDANYKCHVFTFAKTTDDSVFYTTSFGDYRQETLDSMKQSSTYFNDLVNTDQKFISLSTCDLDYGFESSHRFVLTGQLEKTSDDIVLKD